MCVCPGGLLPNCSLTPSGCENMSATEGEFTKEAPDGSCWRSRRPETGAARFCWCQLHKHVSDAISAPLVWVVEMSSRMVVAS